MISGEKCKEILNQLPHEDELIILGENSDELICSAGKHGVAALVIETDNEAEACKNYLLKKGVKRFSNLEQVMEHYGWDGEVKITPCT